MICYLVRHGKDDETVRGGWSQHPLTEEGVRQAEKLAEHIFRNMKKMEIGRIYSSDLPRAMQTAQIIADQIALPIISVEQFREVNNGELAGMNNDLALQRYPGLFWNRMEWEQCYPEGESPKQFYERVMGAWEKFCTRVMTENKNVLLVTHAGAIHVILSIVNGVNYTNTVPHRRINYTEMIALEYDGAAWKEKQAE